MILSAQSNVVLARSLVLFFSVVFCLIFFVPSAFAAITPFRSANIVTTDGYVSYTNLNSCSATDGQTCDRALAASFANLYFRDFGTYGDFGMPEGSTITKIRIRVTGKTSRAIYVAASLEVPAASNCQFPSDLWTMWNLGGNAIRVQNFVTDVVYHGTLVQAISGFCLQSFNFENKRLTFRINYSTFPAWSANIDNLEIAFDYDPPLTPAKTPLILIPGIGGSELKVNEMKVWAENDGHGGTFNYLYPKDETVWLNEGKATDLGNDDYFDVLRMKVDGINSETNLGLTGNLLARAYQGTIDFFISNGYTLNQDLFVFPYDWRKDIVLTAPLLDEKINNIKSQTGSSKVDIIAHSMGGLVARNYISDSSRASNVRKLFTLGTPHLGAVDFLKNLKYGGCLTKEGILTQLASHGICFGLSPSEIKDVIQNMISGFELAPSQSYFNFYSGEDNNHLYPYKIETGPLNYSQIKSLLTRLGYNTSLFNPSEVFHAIDNNLSDTNGVDVTVIAGSSQPTLGQIIEEKTISLLGIPYIHKDKIDMNGDGTVPLFSASLNDSSKNLSLLGLAKAYYTQQKHGDLVASGSALNLVKNILEGNIQLPNGVSSRPYPLSGGWLFSSHSPVNMHFYDSVGNHTGLVSNGDFEANIPGSSYDTLDDAKFIWLSDDGQYDIKFEATDQGSFDFKIRKYENDENTQTILYKEIPLTNNTKAETSFDTQSSEIPIIRIDEDGNGDFDFNVRHFGILEGDANYDFTPPAISFDVNPKSIWPPNNKMVDVNIAGTITDENPYLITILIDDEYNLIERSITIQNPDINQIIRLEASRRGDDKDGRTYKIKILATDLAGNTSLSTAEVIVPHDRRK